MSPGPVPDGAYLKSYDVEAETDRLMFLDMLTFALMGFYESCVAKHARESIDEDAQTSF